MASGITLESIYFAVTARPSLTVAAVKGATEQALLHLVSWTWKG
jgi:hypothetical protein